MQKYFEKIKERLEKQKENPSYITDGIANRRIYDNGIKHAIEIVNQVAEEYGKDANVPSNDGWIPCEIGTPFFEIYEVRRLWVTMHRKGVNFYFSRQLKWNGYEGRWEWDNGKTLSDDWEVVAWRTVDIPAPYKPKGE